MSNKKIGIVGWQSEKSFFGVTAPYLNWVSQFGQPVILTPRKDIEEDLDLLVLPGGPDLSSHFYNEVPGFSNSSPDIFKEYFFKQNLPQYIENGTPIFGICLGMQQLNVHFGGTLTQHFSFDYSATRQETKEELIISKSIGEMLMQYLDIKKLPNFKVNSMHHQSVFADNISNQMQAHGASKLFNNVEIMCHKELPIWGVQYHPEEIYDSISAMIVNKLLNNE